MDRSRHIGCTVQHTDCSEAFSWVKQLLNNCTIGLKLYLILEQKTQKALNKPFIELS